MATKVKPSRINITWVPSVWKVPVYVDDDTFQWWNGWGGWDMSYSDFYWDTESWASITLSLSTEISPTANFTVNAPVTIEEWQVYILRVTNWATAYTMTLWTNISNTQWTDTTLTANATDMFVFLWVWWVLELQKEMDKVTVVDNLTSTSSTDALSANQGRLLNTALWNKLDTSALDNTAYWSSWDWDTTHAPTKDAVYDKFETLWTASTKNTWTSSWNVPVLDVNGKLNKSTLPWVALTDTFTVSTSSDLTNLSSAEQWDLAIVTSENKTYVLATEPYSTAANWKEILSPTWWVTSVNSQTWAVTLDADDISDSTTTNKFVTATDKSTWSGKQDALTLPWSPTSWHLVTWWANNKTLADGWAVPTWVPAVWTNWQVLTVVSWAAAWANATWWWIQNDTTWTTTTVTAIRCWTEAEYNALQSHSASVIYHIY